MASERSGRDMPQRKLALAEQTLAGFQRAVQQRVGKHGGHRPAFLSTGLTVI
jgi:hypothetical protein